MGYMAAHFKSISLHLMAPKHMQQVKDQNYSTAVYHYKILLLKDILIFKSSLQKYAIPFCSKCSKVNDKPARNLNKTNDVLKILSPTDTTSTGFKSSVSTTKQ